uniref:Sepiapterin reductase n=1 Tax=Ciona intestinalis TaxID=7719 RepID=F6WU12_CIOIN
MAFHNSVVIITGTNRGYGVHLSETVAAKLSGDSLLILTARNKDGLEKTKNKIEALINGNNFKVLSVMCDLSKQDKVSGFIAKCLENIDLSKFSTAMFINNAGTLGDVNIKLKDQNNANLLNGYFQFNVINVMMLNSAFLKSFAAKKCFLINISSLAAIQPFSTMGLYCTGKAARDMMFKVLAVENPELRVLNWSPGPMITGMTNTMRGCCDETVATMFKNFDYVPLEVSAAKLMAILEKNEFKSGDHIDYFDEF